ncbi:hypothetical protein [Candidatus Regiella endosymbiont of Tuberolachnus salignus]|uniref:hypothetical protein n=1 Tax=Candidatus Regiella endosymbiont of Tuberolachnus salignus TaxID=3077956 RepID=UPI0030D13BF9
MPTPLDNRLAALKIGFIPFSDRKNNKPFTKVQVRNSPLPKLFDRKLISNEKPISDNVFTIRAQAQARFKIKQEIRSEIVNNKQLIEKYKEQLGDFLTYFSSQKLTNVERNVINDNVTQAYQAVDSMIDSLKKAKYCLDSGDIKQAQKYLVNANAYKERYGKCADKTLTIFENKNKIEQEIRSEIVKNEQFIEKRNQQLNNFSEFLLSQTLTETERKLVDYNLQQARNCINALNNDLQHTSQYLDSGNLEKAQQHLATMNVSNMNAPKVKLRTYFKNLLNLLEEKETYNKIYGYDELIKTYKKEISDFSTYLLSQKLTEVERNAINEDVIQASQAYDSMLHDLIAAGQSLRAGDTKQVQQYFAKMDASSEKFRTYMAMD